jgi:hypothetical protein
MAERRIKVGKWWELRFAEGSDLSIYQAGYTAGPEDEQKLLNVGRADALAFQRAVDRWVATFPPSSSEDISDEHWAENLVHDILADTQMPRCKGHVLKVIAQARREGREQERRELREEFEALNQRQPSRVEIDGMALEYGGSRPDASSALVAGSVAQLRDALTMAVRVLVSGDLQGLEYWSDEDILARAEFLQSGGEAGKDEG